MNEHMLRCLKLVADRLLPLGVDFAFLGGAVLGLIIDDPGAPEARPTNDVDVLVGTDSRAGHTRLEQRLRELGFRHDISQGAPLCRWMLDEVVVDILPVDRRVLGWESKWFADALAHAQPTTFEGAPPLKIITPEYFLATKLEAFRGRGQGDWYGSRDLEDMIAVLDGCSNIVRRVLDAPDALRHDLARCFSELLASRDFLDAIPAHLPPDPASRQRVQEVLHRLRCIAGQDKSDDDGSPSSR